MPSLAEAAALARTRLRADAGRLWGVSLADVEWMGVSEDDILLTADPAVAGYGPVEAGVWSGPRPPAIGMASCPQTWAGRTWAAVELPLPDEPDQAIRMLIHEAFHVVQDQLFPGDLNTERADGMDLLDGAEGRTWLRMELAALAAALESAGREQAADALLFRQRRLTGATATPAEAARERDLDIREGLPEYTAWRLTDATPADVAGRARSLPAGRSWVRWFAYFTGPAYGFLLDALRPGWRSDVLEQPDLQALLASAVAEVRGDAYGLADARLAEQEREVLHRERVERLRQAYTTGPLIRLSLAGQPIAFSNRDVIPLEHGTHRGDLSWRVEDGSVLEAPGGALVTNDFREVWLPFEGTPEVPGTTVGDGWTLRLAAGWTAEAVDDGWKILRQQPG